MCDAPQWICSFLHPFFKWKLQCLRWTVSFHSEHQIIFSVLLILFCFAYRISLVTDWDVQNSTEVFFLSGYRGKRRLKKVLDNIRMFSSEESNLERSVGVFSQQFHTCQGQIFNFLVFSVVLLLTSSSYTSAFTVTSCEIITIFSQKILHQGMVKHPASYFEVFLHLSLLCKKNFH